MEFVDFNSLKRSSSIDLIFPDWQTGENVAFLSPHDDDVILGAGYLLDATIKNGGRGHIFIFCKGDAGYSTVGEKDKIVARRREETIACYRILGVNQENIYFLGASDFSLMPHVNRGFSRSESIFDKQIRLFREKKISRVVFSSGYFEHWDHSAVFHMGIYTSPQATDPILADLGEPSSIKSYLIYSVWGDFEPMNQDLENVRVDKGILATSDTEETIRRAIRAFSSQTKIIKNIVAYREKRRSELGYLELYKNIDVRRQINFLPYFKLLQRCDKI